jgi:hypothetical protein
METYVNIKVTMAKTVVSLSPEGRGRGEGVRKLQNQTPPSEPPQPVLLPSGEKGRSVHVATAPHSATMPHSRQMLTRSGAILG